MASGVNRLVRERHRLPLLASFADNLPAMPKTPPEDLASFVRRQSPDDLASLLIELSNAMAPVRERLERMQLASRPDKLAASFRKQLSGWKRSSRFLDYREAREFGRMLESWLEQVARELQPRDPAAALALFEDFIEADGAWIDRADDSDGAIGNAVREACRHWLEAAARCETPPSAWPERLIRLYDADEYGAREPLLRQADRLLDEVALRELAERYTARMHAAVAGPHEGPELPHEVFHLSGALATLAEVLRDPDIHVRAVLAYSPQPNEAQRESFVRAYLDAVRPADALKWLEGDWNRREPTRRRLLSDALGLLGRTDECVAIRQELFEASLSTIDLRRWLEPLPDAARPQARERSRDLALKHGDAVTAATLLLELEEPAGAEEVLVRTHAAIDGRDYGRLVPLAKALQSQSCPRGETAVLRALMADILGRANARAYGHAARYLRRLREIAETGEPLEPLPAHAAFEQHLHATHPRKVAFWTQVARTGGTGTEGETPDR